MHFVSNPRNVNEVNHIYGNKQNNYFESARTASRLEKLPNGRKAEENAISKACRSLRQPHAGYYWRYK